MALDRRIDERPIEMAPNMRSANMLAGLGEAVNRSLEAVQNSRRLALRVDQNRLENRRYMEAAQRRQEAEQEADQRRREADQRRLESEREQIEYTQIEPTIAELQNKYTGEDGSLDIASFSKAIESKRDSFESPLNQARFVGSARMSVARQLASTPTADNSLRLSHIRMKSRRSWGVDGPAQNHFESLASSAGAIDDIDPQQAFDAWFDQWSSDNGVVGEQERLEAHRVHYEQFERFFTGTIERLQAEKVRSGISIAIGELNSMMTDGELTSQEDIATALKDRRQMLSGLGASQENVDAFTAASVEAMMDFAINTGDPRRIDQVLGVARSRDFPAAARGSLMQIDSQAAAAKAAIRQKTIEAWEESAQTAIDRMNYATSVDQVKSAIKDMMPDDPAAESMLDSLSSKVDEKRRDILNAEKSRFVADFEATVSRGNKGRYSHSDHERMMTRISDMFDANVISRSDVQYMKDASKTATEKHTKYTTTKRLLASVIDDPENADAIVSPDHDAVIDLFNSRMAGLSEDGEAPNPVSEADLFASFLEALGSELPDEIAQGIMPSFESTDRQVTRFLTIAERAYRYKDGKVAPAMAAKISSSPLAAATYDMMTAGFTAEEITQTLYSGQTTPALFNEAIGIMNAGAVTDDNGEEHELGDLVDFMNAGSGAQRGQFIRTYLNARVNKSRYHAAREAEDTAVQWRGMNRTVVRLPSGTVSVPNVINVSTRGGTIERHRIGHLANRTFIRSQLVNVLNNADQEFIDTYGINAGDLEFLHPQFEDRNAYRINSETGLLEVRVDYSRRQRFGWGIMSPERTVAATVNGIGWIPVPRTAEEFNSLRPEARGFSASNMYNVYSSPVSAVGQSNRPQP